MNRNQGVYFSLYSFGFFTKLDGNAGIGITGFTAWKQEKIQWQNVTPSADRTQASHNLWFQVQHSSFGTNLAIACETETLRSLYSHALLIPTKRSKSKVGQERSLKIYSVAHASLALKGEFWTWNQRLWETQVGRTFCHCFFLVSCSKVSDANIGIFV